MYFNQSDYQHIPVRKLTKGGKIAITSPATTPDETKLKKGINYLEKRGYQVIVGDSCYSKLDYLAGDSSMRANELLEFYDDDSIDIIICARGGFGSMQLLNKLDYELIAEKRKLLIGFSDITSLLWAIYSQTGIIGISGMMPAYDFYKDSIPEEEESQFWNLIENGQLDYHFPNSLQLMNNENESVISGIAFAGTLSLISKLIGTPYMPNLTNSLLILEDIGETTHKIEAYLEHLKLSGNLQNSSGILLGNFAPAEKEEYDEVPTFEELIKRVCSLVRVPIYKGLNYGHISNKISIPIGLPLILENHNNGSRIHSNFNLYK